MGIGRRNFSTCRAACSPSGAVDEASAAADGALDRCPHGT
jgi:hypothetical protein